MQHFKKKGVAIAYLISKTCQQRPMIFRSCPGTWSRRTLVARVLLLALRTCRPAPDVARMLEEEALIGLRDGRADCLHRVVEVGGRDDGGVLLVAQRADGRLAHERGEIGAAEAVAPSVERHSRQVHVGRQRSATGSCVQNVHSRLGQRQ
eukprot:6173335-Pleurochrysis_carterae.AAC.2